jgi:universal stress protein A
LRVLVALDYSDCSKLACRWVLTRLSALKVEELIFHHSADPAFCTDLSGIERAAGELREFVAELAEDDIPRGLEVRYAVTAGKPAEEILAAAEAHQTDTIVMGTHGRTGLDRLLLGSVAESVVRMAPCTVVVVKPGPEA